MRLRNPIIFTLALILVTQFLPLVLSADIVYISKNNNLIDSSLIDIVESLGHNVDIVLESDINGFDFSDYDLLIVGKGSFSSPSSIPITEHNSIIINSNYFGLSASSAAKSSPVNLKNINLAEPIIEGLGISYTAYKVTNPLISAISLSGKKSIGINHISYVSGGSNSDPIIASFEIGTKLLNTKTALGRIVFFGIPDAVYWTQDTKKVFSNAVAWSLQRPEDFCSKNNDCNDFDDYTKDTCLNPGTASSKCFYEDIECIFNSDCGLNAWTDEALCSENILMRNFTRYSCKSPGTILSECVEEKSLEIKEQCSNICYQGECSQISCFSDSDCDDDDSYTKDICVSKGLKSSFCQYNPIGCFSDADCPQDTLSSLTCSQNNLVKDLTSYSCKNPGTLNSECKANITSQINQTCNNGCFLNKCRDRLDTCSVLSSDLELNILDPDNNDKFIIGKIKTIINKIELRSKIDDADIDLFSYLYDADEDRILFDDNDNLNLDNGDKETVEFEFDIEGDIEQGNNFYIYSRAETKNSCNEDFVKIDFDRNSHQFSISRFNINPSRISCGDSVYVEIDVENNGRNDAKNIYIIVKNDELGLNHKSDRFDLENYDDSNSKRYSFSFNVPEIDNGEYIISADMMYQSRVDSLEEILIVSGCDEDDTSDRNLSVIRINNPKIVGTSNETKNNIIEEKSGMLSNSYNQILLGVIGVFFLAIISSLVYLRYNKNGDNKKGKRKRHNYIDNIIRSIKSVF